MYWRLALAAVAAAIAAILVTYRVASACSYAELAEYRVDGSSQDREPPAQPVVLNRKVKEDEERAACRSSCGYEYVLRVELEMQDDVTPSAEMGVLVELTSGSLPGSSRLPDGPVELFGGQSFFLRWDNEKRYDFTLRFTPVDRAGNEGEPIELTFDHGIHCSAGGVAGMWLPVLLAIPFALRRRGFRVQSHAAGGRPE